MLPVSNIEIEILFRLMISVALGALVGLEREWTHKPAGLRTHAIVSLGACLFTVVSFFYFSIDPARIAAGIVAGIGFIGAGNIIASRGHVRGITTAATLWVVAAIGLATGVGAYFIALITAILVFVVLQIKKIEEEIKPSKLKKLRSSSIF